jgi:hypothetical protein
MEPTVLEITPHARNLAAETNAAECVQRSMCSDTTVACKTL